jgi:hypothetical protein
MQLCCSRSAWINAISSADIICGHLGSSRDWRDTSMPRVMISLTSFDRRITRHEDILEKMQFLLTCPWAKKMLGSYKSYFLAHSAPESQSCSRRFDLASRWASQTSILHHWSVMMEIRRLICLIKKRSRQKGRNKVNKYKIIILTRHKMNKRLAMTACEENSGGGLYRPLQKRMQSGVRNYVHSWRPLYRFGVCLSLRLRNKCLRHVDRDPAARSAWNNSALLVQASYISAAFAFSFGQVTGCCRPLPQFRSRRI